MLTILDCGHPLTREIGSITTGYGTTQDGKRHCFACCAAHDLADMIAAGRAVMYLHRGKVTNWPGSLSFPVAETRISRRGGGFGAQRTDAWFRGPDGFMWHAINRGDMDLARCRRTRTRY